MCRGEFLLFVLFMTQQILSVAGETDSQDRDALRFLMDEWGDIQLNWIGSDPCGDNWEGIKCASSRVKSIKLPSRGINGHLSERIGGLSELQILDLSNNKDLTGSLPPSIGNLKKLTELTLFGCCFTGKIPDTIGNLAQLVFLSLNCNQFRGEIPPSIGSLSNLVWLDISDNKLTGKIPVSDGSSPGLDMLFNTRHFHFGRNLLSGEIPPTLFSPEMTLIHVLFESNKFFGEIPDTLGLVNTLEIIRLDRNSLSGSIPPNLNSFAKMTDLFLSNNELTGPLPNLTGLNMLQRLDFSNNTFDSSDVPMWLSTLKNLETLVMENTQLQGQVPVELFSLPKLQTVVLSNNRLTGTLEIGSNYRSHLKNVDLSNNKIDASTSGERLNIQLLLMNNPICNESGEKKICCVTPENSILNYKTQPHHCIPLFCSSDQVSSPNCHCQHPFKGNLNFRMPSPPKFKPLEDFLMQSFKSNQLPVDSVSLENPRIVFGGYLVLSLEVFPSCQDYFNRTGISEVSSVLSNMSETSFYFIAENYNFFEISGTHKSLNTGVLIGEVLGAFVLVLLLIGAGIYVVRRKRRAEMPPKQNNPFASWDPNKHCGGIPQLKGTRSFSFDEIKKCTNNFSDANGIACGGYGKVYKGVLPCGQLIAIKRAHQRSMQGALEFKNEIELLSRVHHRNLVALVGFCFEQGEQMLVYEYIPNGSLKDSLSGKSGIRLAWARRLEIALGAARGLHYLHDLANPPIIHRDIKSNNILLDEYMVAKVADFGLSKPMGDVEKGHVTTQVKGTMGYLDPEYYMTQQLTEKSDVYSFGVLLLELLTARNPIEKGKYIVREVRHAIDKTQELYNLHGILDQTIGLSPTPNGLERFVDLAMSCVDEATLRPTMGEVVKEIEGIMELACLNQNAEPTEAASYDEASTGFEHSCSSDSLFAYSGACPPPNLEPK